MGRLFGWNRGKAARIAAGVHHGDEWMRAPIFTGFLSCSERQGNKVDTPFRAAANRILSVIMPEEEAQGMVENEKKGCTEGKLLN